jgi:hypothetical protein
MQVTLTVLSEDGHTFTIASVRWGTQWDARYFSSSLVFTLFCMPVELLTFLRLSLTCKSVDQLRKFASSIYIQQDT